MTNELSDLAHNVRMLELEVQKLELNNRIAQLKAEPTIDEECVGCCKVVDVAANLQYELDELKTDCDWWRQSALNTEKSRVLTSNKLGEYKETIQLERIDHITTLKTVNQYYQTKIEELKDKHTADLNELYDIDKREYDNLKAETRELKHRINCFEDIRAYLKNVTKQQENTVSGLMRANTVLEAELSARKQDSEVLLKVVDTIRCWESTPIGGLAAVTEIKDIIDDYLDAPEGPEDTPIDEPQEITVTFAYLELP